MLFLSSNNNFAMKILLKQEAPQNKRPHKDSLSPLRSEQALPPLSYYHPPYSNVKAVKFEPLLLLTVNFTPSKSC